MSDHAIPSDDTRTSQREYFVALDGVRGLGILGVILFHNYGVRGGWIGVDLFFALSGFLITRILSQTRGQEDYYKRFYIRRTLRIFPIYYVLLAIVALGDPSSHDQIWWYVAYLGDFYGLFGFEIPGLQHTWSLAIEEQFYLLWPAVVAAMPAWQLSRLCVVALVIPIATRYFAIHEGLPSTFTMFNILTRCEPLLLGAILGSLAAERGRTHWRAGRSWIVAWASIVVSVLLLAGFLISTRAGFRSIGEALPINVSMVAVAFASAGVVWLGYLERPGLFNRVLSWSLLRHLGRISYGVYLFNQPVNVYLEPLLHDAGLTNRWLVGSVLFALTVVLAMLSWRWIEKPIIGLKARFAPQPSRESNLG